MRLRMQIGGKLVHIIARGIVPVNAIVVRVTRDRVREEEEGEEEEGGGVSAN